MNALAILDLILKSLALLSGAFAVLSLWRRASAAQRGFVWLMAFVGLLALPLTLLIPPLWTIAHDARKISPPTTAPLVPSQSNVVNEIPTAVAYVLPAPRVASLRFSPWQIGAALWLGGTFVMLMHHLLGVWQLRRLRASSVLCTDDDLRRLAAGLAAALAIRREVELRMSSTLSVPVTWGVLRPVVLLPGEALQWNAQALSAALLHELAHIRHRDAASRMLATLVCALHWPNPMVWLAARAWRIAQEQSADDAVLRHGAAAPDYAMQLVEAARAFQKSNHIQAPVLAMARRATLETRLSAIMDDARNRAQLNRQVLGVASVVAVLFMTGLSCLRLQAQTPPAPATTDAQTPRNVDGVPLLSPTEITPGTKLIAVEVKFIEAPAGRLPNHARDGAGEVLSKEALNVLLRTLLKNSEAKVSSYPRMVTLDNRGVSFRSVVNLPVPQGSPPVFTGTVLNVLPTAREGYVDLVVDLTVNEQVGENDGLPKISSRQANITLKVPHQHTAVVGLTPWQVQQGPPPNKDLVCLVTPHLLDAGTTSAFPAMQQRASAIMLPRVHFTDATLDEALEFLRVKASQLAADRRGINIIVTKAATSSKISLDLEEVTVDELLRHIARQSGLELRYFASAAVLSPPGTEAVDIGSQTGSEGSPAVLRARALMVPKVDFREAAFQDVVRYIRDQSRKLSADGSGLNIVMDENSPAAQTLITCHLEHVSFLDVLQHVAALGGFELAAEGNSLTLTPVKR